MLSHTMLPFISHLYCLFTVFSGLITGRPGQDEIGKVKDLQLLHVTIPSFY